MSADSAAQMRFFDPQTQEYAAVFEGARTRTTDGGVFAWMACADDADIIRLQAACRAAGRPLLGARFPLVIHGERFTESGLWLCCTESMPVHGVVPIDPELNLASPGLAADAVADAVERALPAEVGAPGPFGTLWLMFDGAVPNIGGILDALYLRLGTAVRYAGVNAGLETFEPSACLFDENAVVTGGLAWAYLPAHPGAVLQHDYQATQGAHLATTASGNRVESVDFRPAYSFYCDRVREVHGVALDATNFYEHAADFPLAIQLANGQIVLRMPIALEADGAIRCSADIPENALLVMAEVTPGTSTEFATAVAARAAAGGVADPRLLFYCAGRRLRLGAAQGEDLAALRAAFGAPLAGAMTLGEIGSVETGGYPMLHNGALVSVGWRVR